MSYIKNLVCGVLYGCVSVAMAHSYQGTLEVSIEDNFEKNQNKYLYYLHEANEVYELQIPKNIKKDTLLTGDHLIIEGKELINLQKQDSQKERILQVESLTVKSKATSDSADPGTFETRRILTLLVNFVDKKATNTVTIPNVDSILYTSPQSLVVNYQRNSFGQLNFVRDVNNDGSPDIYQVNVNYSIGTTCDYRTWGNDAKLAAQLAGINTSLYQHFMFVVPQNVSCSWGGVANIGCSTFSCNAWVKAYNPGQTYSKLVYTHELGHTLGMRHSGLDTNNDGVVDSDYGDAACIMGTGDFQFLKELNAPHRDQMGWLRSFPNKIVTVDLNTKFMTVEPLGALEDGLGETWNKLMVKVAKNASENYYVSLRRNNGPFGTGAPNYLDKVSIHRANAGSTLTYFIKALAAGESFVDTTNKITIKVYSIVNNRATVEISRQ